MSIGSGRQADRINRTVLTVLGLLLLAAGVSGLIYLSTTDSSDATIVGSGPRRWLLDQSTVAALLGALLVVVLMVALVSWLRRQIQPISKAETLTTTRSESGTTTIASGALTDAVAADLMALRGVAAASARIRATDPDTIDVAIDVEDTTTLTQVVDEARTLVLPRARTATGRPELTLDVECRLVPPRGPARVV